MINIITTKWNMALNRNCDKNVFGKNVLYKRMIFYPFLKSQMPKDFEFCSDFFQSFNSNIISNIPGNNDIETLEYRLSSVNFFYLSITIKRCN